MRRLLDAVSTLAALAAIVIAWTALKARSGPVVQAIGEPVPFRGWSKYEPGGHLIGNANAKVRLVEFGDYECPACRGKQPWIAAVLQEFGPRLALEYRYLPIPYHRAAYPAARAAECAAAQGRFSEFHGQLWKQDAWLTNTGQEFPKMARAAGIADIAAFEKCIQLDEPVPAVEADIQLAHEIGVPGTPTLVLDGTDLSSVDSIGLVEAISGYLASRR